MVAVASRTPSGRPLSPMLKALKRTVVSDAADEQFECRLCRTAVTEQSDDYPSCGSREIRRYSL